MKWQKHSTILPAYAGTCEPLLGSLPKAIQKLRTSLTRSTTRWVFSTPGSMETWMAERVAMSQHQETIPRVRVTLLTQCEPRNEEWTVWEVVDLCPPSTATELEPSSSPDDPRRGSLERQECRSNQCLLPGLVMEVSADGEVTTWPGPEVVEA